MFIFRNQNQIVTKKTNHGGKDIKNQIIYATPKNIMVTWNDSPTFQEENRISFQMHPLEE